ncbi:MAG: PKD domain-containing protein [Crocinitomicaceae bacterium]|nr:PKD domain-containing protein [Crocinitomicaceae bacterium]
MLERILPLSFALIVTYLSYAQDTASVLFIGNSYTYGNNLPSMFSTLSSSLGDQVDFDSHTAGGATFNGHANNPAVYTKINSEAWDYVVLQAQSQEPSFPDAQVNANTLPFAIQLADSVYTNNICSEVMMFMTWGRENGDPQWAPISTFDGMNARLRAAYMRMADSVGGSVSPVGVAWKYVRDNHPTIGLYTGDGSHPNFAGTYLAACTFYASVFRKSPVGSPYIGSLSAQVAADLQNAAAVTVLDSLEQFNLRPTSEHTQADYSFVINGSAVDFTNLSTDAITYTWDFGNGGSSSDENPSYSYPTNGFYTVTLVAEGPCDIDSVQYEIEINIASLNENKQIYKLRTLGSGQYEILGLNHVESVELYNAAGQKVRFELDLTSTIKVDASQNDTGIYILKVASSTGVDLIRLAYVKN